MLKLKKLASNHRIITCMIVCVITLLLSGLFDWDQDPVTGLDKMVGDLAITGFCIVLMHWLGILKGAGFRRSGFLRGLVLGIPFYIIGIVSIIASNPLMNWNDLEWRGITVLLTFALNMLLVGVNEEVLMRSLVFTYLEEGYPQGRKGTRKAIVLSALIFGAIHLPNMFFLNPLVVIVQAVNAAAAGVLFTVIFSRTRNIWANILIHTIVDFTALVIEKCFVGGSSVLSVQLNLGTAIGMIVAGSVPPLVIAWWYEKKNS